MSSDWVAESKDLLLRHSPDGVILARIIKVPHQRVSLGLFTMFIRIRAHRGEFLSKKADRWADEGREDVDNVQWDGPSSHPTFSWTDAGVEHRCSMNKTLWTRVHLKVAELKLPLHKNFTSAFLNREDYIRDLLGKHWQDKTVPDRSKRRLLQSIGYQFPCAKLLKLWCLRQSDECMLCKRLHPEVTPRPDSLGHIQARCPALRKPRTTAHHGIWLWRELLSAISRSSVDTHDHGERKWYFPSAISEATHDEWTVRQIFVHLGLFSGIRRLIEDVITFHARQNISLTSEDITSFYGRRPDGVAFNANGNHCVVLEFTRPIDSVTSSDEGD